MISRSNIEFRYPNRTVNDLLNRSLTQIRILTAHRVQETVRK